MCSLGAYLKGTIDAETCEINKQQKAYLQDLQSVKEVRKFSHTAASFWPKVVL